MRNKIMSEQSLVNGELRIQNTEARSQKNKYSDSCLLTPEFLFSIYCFTIEAGTLILKVVQ